MMMMVQARSNESIIRSLNPSTCNSGIATAVTAFCSSSSKKDAVRLATAAVAAVAPLYPSYIPLFPWNLHDALEANQDDTIVTWIPRDKQDQQDQDDEDDLPPNEFKILNQEEFVNKILKVKFQQTKYKSFQRQLNLWGFERTKNGGYTNRYFVKGKKSLCQYMTRKQRPNNKNSSSSTSAKKDKINMPPPKTTIKTKKTTPTTTTAADKQIDSSRLPIASSSLSSSLDQAFCANDQSSIHGARPLPAMVAQVSECAMDYSKIDGMSESNIVPTHIACAHPVLYNVVEQEEEDSNDHSNIISCSSHEYEQDDDDVVPIELESIPLELESKLFDFDILWGKKFYLVE